MNPRHLLLALLLFFGCSQPPIDPPQPPPQGVEYAPRPAAEPEVDKTFMDSANVQAWRAQIVTAIEADAAVPHPRDLWRYTADFRVDRSRPDPILGDPSVWDAISIVDQNTDEDFAPVPAPRADEALALEANDQELDAAELWIALNRLDDAKRCSTELEKEGEWKAVAMIAVHTGDLAALDRATKKMVDAGQFSRTQDVASYAFLEGKIDIAKHIAITHGWELSEILSPYQVRELALKGDASILRELLEGEIAAWESEDLWSLGLYRPPVTVVADIAILGKTDKVKAREYAGRYLRLPSANVLVWTQCGEACYSTPIRGTLELYQLIASDQELRELYFARLRMAIDYMFPMGTPEEGDPPRTTIIAGLESEGYSDWNSDLWGYGMGGNLSTSYLLRVRSVNDRELTAFWVALLDTFPSRSDMDGTLEFEREIGRCALGLPFKKDLGDPPVRNLVLDVLSGGSVPGKDETWDAWNQKYPSRQDLEGADLDFQFFTRGEVSPQRETAIRAELGIEAVPGEETDLRYELCGRFRRSLYAHYGEVWGLRQEFKKAQDALKINVAAQGLRQERDLPAVELYPDTDAEYDELMAPSLALLCDQLPAKCSLWPRLAAPVATVIEAVPTEPPAPVASANQPAAPSAEPTNCTFVSGSRPQIGEKYVVTCDGGTYLANGEYKGGGVFAFSAFTPHTP